jgi:hypothetical protein
MTPPHTRPHPPPRPQRRAHPPQPVVLPQGSARGTGAGTDARWRRAVGVWRPTLWSAVLLVSKTSAAAAPFGWSTPTGHAGSGIAPPEGPTEIANRLAASVSYGRHPDVPAAPKRPAARLKNLHLDAAHFGISCLRPLGRGWGNPGRCCRGDSGLSEPRCQSGYCRSWTSSRGPKLCGSGLGSDGSRIARRGRGALPRPDRSARSARLAPPEARPVPFPLAGEEQGERQEPPEAL